MRERKEKLAQQELARSISQLSDRQQGLRSAEAVVEHAHAEQRDAAVSGTSPAADLLARQVFLERVEAERARHRMALQRSEAEVADRNAKLAAAASDHEMLIRLRERRSREHDIELARRESNVNDELAAIRFRRSSLA